jgi:LmbE family N-acetylglucosaminyl deacetylase
MKRIIPFFLLQLVFTTQVFAQSPAVSSTEILQKLKKLNTLGSLLYIAAHPDDENTRLLPYLTYERNYQTGYLSLTRGDGGQNLIGKEQGPPLGLIRTQELLAARSIDGAEQFFTRANDFGFSKNPDETFSFWNKDSILADVVWVIRTFKPDVIITRFPTTGEGGHGHHTASAILAMEAFTAAADPTRFPEQLKYTTVWQAQRIFWNTFKFGSMNTTSEDQIKVNIGGYNPLLGKSYGELASENRSMHKSQGFGTAKTRGDNIEYFKQLGGAPVSKDIFENINTSWSRFPNTQTETSIIDKMISTFDPEHPEKTCTDLANLYKQIKAINPTNKTEERWKNEKLKETENILLDCSGFWIEAYASDYIAIPGNEIQTSLQLINRGTNAITVKKIEYIDADSTLSLNLKSNEYYTFLHTATLSKQMPYSNPYWLNAPHSSGLYTVTNQLLIGKAQNDAAETITVELELNGISFSIHQPIVYKYTDPVKGEIYRPLEVLPKITVNATEHVYAFTDNVAKPIQFSVKANEANINGTIEFTVPQGWKVTCAQPSFQLKEKGEEIILTAWVQALTTSVNGKISASVKVGSDTYSQSITRIEYDHIPYQFILKEADANLVFIPIKTAGKNIGYIPGAGDDVAACLKQIGYTVTILTDELLDKGNLKQFNAIVTGIRAYNTNDRLQVYYPTLMKYVEQGGNLIVQYNTNNRIGPLLAKIGPYPFAISRDRVTDELAEVKILQAKSSVFTYPNKIDSTDFNGWIQERGIYFATDLDPKYETVLSMHDKNEKPSEGSLIIAKYGKGNFVYTGLVFFRELPAGVPGAYRLFVNILSIPQNK